MRPSQSTVVAVAILTRINFRGLLALNAVAFASLVQFQLPDVFGEAKANMYNVLWVLVFGFATLNILGLAFRRFETKRMGLTLGEIIAILVVVFSLLLFGLEIVGLLHILPIHLTPR
ncbi:MAG TPA: hypothetical protein VMB18_00315 [Terriglobales bacterium]|nr:hypothetical protein [Terriglobales bacterium]